ncbi:hypothetical protein PPTG_09665 [Phytophthora nicotianae INRA-310]|uniref:Cas12f1-like TNB domain-containing protein n=1 Tax=Phytophthora nicotianae (strain INRA-310) TaxID=761204 RepID=W2QIB2_PHYN3|nr:hypothetical protein PPTG_09665 [Phytophthora nicotianae INRA-310]ETN12010.1 hypothetical protein PPTG_09665 [Phytophthora nicotianae INRA-310]
MDGYGASRLLFRPKTEANDEERAEKRSSEHPVILTGYVPDAVVGLDPGMRTICTTVTGDLRSNRKRHCRQRRRRSRRGKETLGSHRRKSDHPHWIRTPKAPQRQCDRDVDRISTREYRHLAGFNKFRKWNECLKKRDGEYQRVIADMPSFKTASLKKYLECLDYFWRHANFLLEFCAEHPFLKWKFFMKRMARVAVDAIAKNASFQRSHAYSPVKGLKQALQKRAMVVSMDEFMTSKLCSQCHQTLSFVQYLVATKFMKRKKRKGTVLIRNRPEVQFEKKKCYGVLRCDHEGCGACYWDRDVNAAINMLELLKSEILGLGRMVPFNRK